MAENRSQTGKICIRVSSKLERPKSAGIPSSPSDNVMSPISKKLRQKKIRSHGNAPQNDANKSRRSLTTEFQQIGTDKENAGNNPSS